MALYAALPVFATPGLRGLAVEKQSGAARDAQETPNSSVSARAAAPMSPESEAKRAVTMRA